MRRRRRGRVVAGSAADAGSRAGGQRAVAEVRVPVPGRVDGRARTPGSERSPPGRSGGPTDAAAAARRRRRRDPALAARVRPRARGGGGGDAAGPRGGCSHSVREPPAARFLRDARAR